MVFFAALAAIVASVIYSSGIAAPMYLDDAIVLNNADGFVQSRTLGYGSFWLSHQLANALGFVFPWDVTVYYRIPNVLIHVLAASAVFWLARELTGKRITAGLAGALFLVHPIQTQAVTYLSQRFESQATLFMVISAASFVRFRKRHSRWWVAATLLSGIAAGMTKETAVALPLWLLLIEIVLFSGIPRLKYVGIALPFVFVLAYPAWRVFRSAGATVTWIPFEQYLYSQGAVFLKYLRLIFVPGRQFLLYDFPPATGLTGNVLASWALLLSLVGLALYLCRGNRVATFGLLTFFVLLSPTSVVPIPDLIFEHRVYPAMAGIAIAVASIVPPRRSWVVLFSLVFIFLGYRTFERNAEWNDRIRFFEAHREAFPRDAKILASLAASYASVGEVKRALATNLEAKKYLDTLNPFYFKSASEIVDTNLAILFSQMSDPVRAMEHSRRALALQPQNTLAMKLLSRAQSDLGDYEAAQKTLQRVLELEPADPEALLRIRELTTYLGPSEVSAAAEARLSEMHAATKEPVEPEELSKAGGMAKPGGQPKNSAAIMFGLIMGILGVFLSIFAVLKRHLGEVVRWIRTGSTVSVDSAASPLPKQ